MRDDIPGIDDLTRGINDADMAFGGNRPSTDENKETSSDANKDGDICWLGFLAHAGETPIKEGREEWLACKLDRDLADSLDDCDIHNRCRSDLVNAIVRAFFEAYLPRLAKYRREKKSLFSDYHDGKESHSHTDKFGNPDNR